MPIHVFKSTDAGAPTLSGTPGDLITVLDACLIDGYGAKLPVGWTKEFSGTNKAAYLQPFGSNGYYLQVLDEDSRTATCRGMESMTDVDNGLNEFPPIGVTSYCEKSNVAGATANPWALYSNGSMIYLFVTLTASAASSFSFGDFISVGPSDTTNTLIQKVIDISGSRSDTLWQPSGADTYLARSYDTTIVAPVAQIETQPEQVNVSGLPSFAKVYPDRITGKLNLNAYYMLDGNNSVNDPIRGIYPGIVAITNVYTTTAGLGLDTFTDQNGIVYDVLSTGPAGTMAIQVTGEW